MPDGSQDAQRRTPPGWLHFAAGGLGGMCGAIIASPLDVVKTRLQSDLYKGRAVQSVSQRGVLGVCMRGAMQFVDTGRLLVDIARREGPKALFKGLGPTLVGVIPARSINFSTYGMGKRFYSDMFHDPDAASPLVHLSAAATAGVVTATATNPIWVVKTRLQLESQRVQAEIEDARRRAVQSGKRLAGHAAVPQAQRRSLWTRPRAAATQFFRPAPRPSHPTNALRMTVDIVRNEGIAGLYKGLSASYLGVTESTIQWMLYEQFKRFQVRPERGENTPWWMRTISAAGSAKMIATLITYPHEVLRTRLRQQPAQGTPKYTGLAQTFCVVWREEGIAAFYGGLTAHLLRVIPNAIVMFSIYETVLKLGTQSSL